MEFITFLDRRTRVNRFQQKRNILFDCEYDGVVFGGYSVCVAHSMSFATQNLKGLTNYTTQNTIN